ncbi:hypothetical protein ES703_115169 [subsurface metagenome]
MPWRASFDPEFGAGLKFSEHFGTGADEHNSFCPDVTRIFSDDNGPFGQFFPQFWFSVLDHVKPVQKNAMASPGAVWFSAEDMETTLDIFDIHVAEVKVPGFFLKVFQGYITGYIDVFEIQRAVPSFLGYSEISDFFRNEIQDVSTDCVMGDRVFSHDNNPQMYSMLC